MKSTAAFTRGVRKIRREWLAGHFDRALMEVDRLLLEWPDNPRLLIMWADLVQLQDDEGPSLAEAKAAYRRALDLDENSVGALQELGLFAYSIEDNSRAALEYFAKAAAVCTSSLEHALLGQAEACADLERWSDAEVFLRKVQQLQSSRDRSSNGKNGRELAGRAKVLLEHVKKAMRQTKAAKP